MSDNKEKLPLPADWALEEAIRLRNEEAQPSRWVQGIDGLKEQAILYPQMVALARLIEKTMTPPVAPELLAAREWAVKDMPGQTSYCVTQYKNGSWDNSYPIKAFLAGVEWQRNIEKGK